MKKFKNLAVYAVLLIIIGIVVLMLLQDNSARNTKYSDIINYFREGKVESFTIDSSTLKLKLKEANSEGKFEEKYTLYSVGLFIEDVRQYIQDENTGEPKMEYDLIPQAQTPVWVSAIPYILIIIMVIVFGFFMFGQMSGGGGAGKAMSFSKARLKVGNDSKTKVMFKDVAGAEEEKEELAEVVDFLKNPKRFTELGARIPRGILMVGSPGTGKTYLAKATAGEAGVPFFLISGSDFVELYVGVGASRVRDTFDQAKKNAPCIVFIDEIDAVGRQRGAGLGGGNDEREQTLNQLLVEMDGFEKNEGVIVMAATNRPDILDSALLRPGRFDRQIVIHLPDVKAREEILRIHSRNKPLADDVNLNHVAKSTAGFSPADLENIMNESALLCARRRHKKITAQDVDDAILKVIVGVEKKSAVKIPKDRRITAVHEAGHAVVSRFLENQDPVHEISIIPRGMAAGYTYYVPSEDKQHMSKKEILDSIVGLLGGRVAEEVVLDDVCTGASNDIERATALARDMVTKYGMSELGAIAFGNDNDQVFLGRDLTTQRNCSDETEAKIDAEIKRIIDEAYARAKKILTENKDKLIKVSDYLIEREKLSAEEFDRIMKGEDLEPLDGKENNGGKSDDDGKAASETEVKAEDQAEEKTSETADGKPEDSSNGEE